MTLALALIATGALVLALVLAVWAYLYGKGVI